VYRWKIDVAPDLRFLAIVTSVAHWRHTKTLYIPALPSKSNHQIVIIAHRLNFKSGD